MKSGRTILHQAVEASNIEVVKYLLQRPDLSIDQTTFDLSTALDLAVGRRLAEMENLLTAAGGHRSEMKFCVDDLNEDDYGDDDSVSKNKCGAFKTILNLYLIFKQNYYIFSNLTCSSLFEH